MSKNKHIFTECIDGLFHKITKWCIKYEVIKATASIFQNNALQMLCFDKLPGEDNNKNNFNFFVL